MYMPSIVHQHLTNDDRNLVSKEAAWISPFRVGGAGACRNDTSRYDPGLDEQSYHKTRTSVTGAAVFEPQARGTQTSLFSLRHPRLGSMFTYPASTAQGWDRANGPFLGEMLCDACMAEFCPGCAASKYVCERVSRILLLGVYKSTEQCQQVHPRVELIKYGKGPHEEPGRRRRSSSSLSV